MTNAVAMSNPNLRAASIAKPVRRFAAIAAVFVDVRTMVNAVECDFFVRQKFLHANVDCGEHRSSKYPRPIPD